MNSSPSTLVKDPVCGMNVDPAKAKAQAEHNGQNYYFCCAGCAQKFRSNPDEYLKPTTAKPVLVTLGAPLTEPKPSFSKTAGSGLNTRRTAYICPMCPEARQERPGPCPSCGMALEP